MIKNTHKKESLLSVRGNPTRKAILTALVEAGVTIDCEDFLFLDAVAQEEERANYPGNAAEQLSFL